LEKEVQNFGHQGYFGQDQLNQKKGSGRLGGGTERSPNRSRFREQKMKDTSRRGKKKNLEECVAKISFLKIEVGGGFLLNIKKKGLTNPRDHRRKE